MCRRIFKEQTSETGDIPFYKIGTFGAEPDAFISRELFEEYKSKYPYPKKGDILISASGSIGRTVEFAGNNEYFQDSNIVWLSHDERLSNSFLKCFYSVVKWAGIEGSTIKRLYNDNILNTVICMPSVPEQEHIGLFFENLDNLITLHQKKCFLRSLSSFSIIAISWEQRKLGDLIIQGGSGGTPTATKSEYYGGTIPFLSIADIKDRDIKATEKTITETGLNNSAAWIVPKGAISLAMYASVGKVGILSMNSATSQAFFNMVFDNATIRNFVYYRLVKADFAKEWEPLISTGTQRNLNAEKVKKFSFCIPSIDEMKRVSDFLWDLDNLITLHQRKHGAGLYN